MTTHTLFEAGVLAVKNTYIKYNHKTIPSAPTLLKVRVSEVPSQFADDLDCFQVTGALQSQDSLNCQFSKVVFVLRE